MSGYADRHWHELAARIEQEFAARRHQLAQGLAKSHEEYRERVGYLNALRDIGAWSEEIGRAMDAKPTKREA